MTVDASGLKSGTLYVIATPIGNLEDITYRAVRLLGEVDLVAAEDTRHSRKLLAHYGVTTPLLSYHEHNEHERATELLKRLTKGASVALISDAGTPCIADPGYRLVHACAHAGIRIVPVPGPSAVIAALSAGGVPTDRFAFEGYLPAKARARADRLKQLQDEPRTLVLYETPHRLLKALADIIRILGEDRRIVVARELTKLHEELYRGTTAQARAHFQRIPVKGELVILLAPTDVRPQINMRDALFGMLADSGLTRREVVKLIAREYGVPQSDVYRESLKFKKAETRDG